MTLTARWVCARSPTSSRRRPNGRGTVAGMEFTGQVEGVKVTLTVKRNGIGIKVDGETGGGASFRTAEDADAHLTGLAIGLKHRKPDTAGATR